MATQVEFSAEDGEGPRQGFLSRVFDRIGFSRLGRWQGLPLALAILLAFLALRWVDPPQLEWLRLRLFDVMQNLSPRPFKQDPVVIVDVDEASLTEYGQWPWPRHRMAEIVKRVAVAKPLVVGMDILFSEPDRLSPENLENNLPNLPAELREGLTRLPSNDKLFGESLTEIPVVLGIAASNDLPGQRDSASHPKSAYLVRGPDPITKLPSYDGFLRNLPQITESAAGEGVLNGTPDRDGVVRRLPMLAAVDGKIYPALSLEILRVMVGAKWFLVQSDEDGVTGVSIGDFHYPTDSAGRIWLHYTPSLEIRYVSAADVLAGNLTPATFANHIVLIGTSSTGLHDLQQTPLRATMPGIEIHAQALEMMIAGLALTRPDFARWLELGLILVAGALLLTLIPLFRPVLSALPVLLLLAVLAALAWYGFTQRNWLIDVSQPALASLTLWAVMSASTWAAVDRQRRVLSFDLAQERAAAALVQGELSAARRIQMGILPRQFPAYPSRTEFDLHALIEPARSVGGDLYDFALLDRDHLFFMVGDVSGKGVPASLFMALSKALYKSGALRLGRDIAQIMSDANVEISRENPETLFVTVLAGILNLNDGTLEMCNAGHDAPFFHRAGTAATQLEIDGGPPLGILSEFDYPGSIVELAPGDVVLLSSDGISEAMNRQSDMFGNERIRDYLDGLGNTDIAMSELVDNLAASVSDFTDGAEASDDITILALRYLGPDPNRRNVISIER